MTFRCLLKLLNLEQSLFRTDKRIKEEAQSPRLVLSIAARILSATSPAASIC